MTMISLNEAAQAWGSGQFRPILKAELEALPVGQLPLQQGMRVASYALDERPVVMVLSCTDAGELVNILIGISYRGMIAGCSCADDPTPVEAVNEYCELCLVLHKQTGMATVSLVEA
jgi:hypothetical protein